MMTAIPAVVAGVRKSGDRDAARPRRQNRCGDSDRRSLGGRRERLQMRRRTSRSRCRLWNRRPCRAVGRSSDREARGLPRRSGCLPISSTRAYRPDRVNPSCFATMRRMGASRHWIFSMNRSTGPTAPAFLVTASRNGCRRSNQLPFLPIGKRMSAQRVEFLVEGALRQPRRRSCLRTIWSAAVEFVNEFAPEHLQIHAGQSTRISRSDSQRRGDPAWRAHGDMPWGISRWAPTRFCRRTRQPEPVLR